MRDGKMNYSHVRYLLVRFRPNVIDGTQAPGTAWPDKYLPLKLADPAPHRMPNHEAKSKDSEEKRENFQREAVILNWMSLFIGNNLLPHNTKGGAGERIDCKTNEVRGNVGRTARA